MLGVAMNDGIFWPKCLRQSTMYSKKPQSVRQPWTVLLSYGRNSNRPVGRSWNGGGCKEMKWGGVFVKKWTFPPQNKTKPIFCILHLLIRGVRTHPPHPPCLGAWVSCRGWRMKMATVLNVSYPTNALCNKTRLQILTDGPPDWLIELQIISACPSDEVDGTVQSVTVTYFVPYLSVDFCRHRRNVCHCDSA